MTDPMRHMIRRETMPTVASDLRAATDQQIVVPSDVFDEPGAGSPGHPTIRVWRPSDSIAGRWAPST